MVDITPRTPGTLHPWSLYKAQWKHWSWS